MAKHLNKKKIPWFASPFDETALNFLESINCQAYKIASPEINDLDLIESNEAFAAQALACVDMLDMDIERVNVSGGAIAIGHPLGASGARIATTLIHNMRARQARYGLATMCIGVGQGIATIFENIDS